MQKPVEHHVARHTSRKPRTFKRARRLAVRLFRIHFVVGLLVAVGVAIPNWPTAATQAATQAATILVVPGSVKDAFQHLAVAAETPQGYVRALFPHWVDANNNCRNTRAEVLTSESQTPVWPPKTTCSTVYSGRWLSWYDQKTWTLAYQVDIDHVVALKEAWDSGAKTWSTSKRQAFANDIGVPYALEAVTKAVNEAKSDKDPADWVPSEPSMVCRYVTNWILIKYRWGLSIDSREQASIGSRLTGACGNNSVVLPTSMAATR